MSTSATDRVARQFADRTLPAAEWTHEAHLRVGLWTLLRFSPDEALERLRKGIQAYNITRGVPNSGTSGYHETLTRFYVAMIEHFLEEHDRDMAVDRLAELLVEELGDRDMPLEYYSRDLLYAQRARREWVEPDLMPLPHRGLSHRVRADADLPPRRIETERLVIRQCRPEEVDLLRAAVDTSLDHLRAWMPWAMHEPRSVQATRDHIEKNLGRFDRGEDFSYNIFELDESQIVGGIGLHRRSDPDCLEIGYWMRESRVGRGYATEATRALTVAALNLSGIRRVQIDCDPANRASVRVAEKVGYALSEHRMANKLTPGGQPRDTLMFEISDLSRVLVD